MRKILIFSAVLLAICLTVGAASADDGWSFNFSSGESTDGGDFSLKNEKLELQDIEFTIPDGYTENESARKLAMDAENIEDAKFSACHFVNGDKKIFVKVFFSDNKFTTLTPMEGQVEKTLAGIDGVYSENEFGDNTPTFKYLKDGKLVEVNAPDNDTIVSIIKN